jgi:hypothetical protein
MDNSEVPSSVVALDVGEESNNSCRSYSIEIIM